MRRSRLDSGQPVEHVVEWAGRGELVGWRDKAGVWSLDWVC
ncbi:MULTISPECIES: hypothetical protein [Gardnerella]|nr:MULTISPECIES: hypothetical protein [Gardnerella]